MAVDNNTQVVNGVILLDNIFEHDNSNYSVIDTGHTPENQYENHGNGTNDTMLLDLELSLSWTRFTVQRIVIPVVISLGSIGNLISIAVWTRRWMRSSTNNYLTALAICDTLYLLFAASMCFTNYENNENYSWYMNYQYPIGRPLVDTFSNSGVWLTLTFTMERWVCVSHPMKGRIWCTTKKAKYIVFIICFLAALITVPEFFEYQVLVEGNRTENCTSSVRKQLVLSSFAKSKFYRIGYVYACQLLFTFLPLLLLLVFNSLLISSVLTAAKHRKSMVRCDAKVTLLKQPSKAKNNRSATVMKINFRCNQGKRQKSEQRVTLTLICIVIVFLLCHSPQAVLNLYISYLEYRKYTISVVMWYKFRIAGNLCNLLVIINASVNFVLYSAFSTKFRRTLNRIMVRAYNKLTRVNLHYTTTNHSMKSVNFQTSPDANDSSLL